MPDCSLNTDSTNRFRFTFFADCVHPARAVVAAQPCQTSPAAAAWSCGPGKKVSGIINSASHWWTESSRPIRSQQLGEAISRNVENVANSNYSMKKRNYFVRWLEPDRPVNTNISLLSTSWTCLHSSSDACAATLLTIINRETITFHAEHSQVSNFLKFSCCNQPFHVAGSEQRCLQQVVH